MPSLQVGGGQLPPHLKSGIQTALLSLYNAQAQVLMCDNLAGRLQAAPETGALRVDWSNFKFVNTVRPSRASSP
eukprot:3454817-Rhodomonas_salina.2